jgi:hypothetical protein
MPSTRIDFLIDKYFQSSCSEEELQELMEWVDASSETELGQKLAGIWKNFFGYSNARRDVGTNTD